MPKPKKCRKCDVELSYGGNTPPSSEKWGDFICNACKAQQKKEKGRRRKLMAIEYKGGKCEDCNEEYPPRVYDFHHLDPTEKEYSVSKMLRGTTWEKTKQELDKCVLLCANCHRIRHADEDEL